MKLPKIRFGFFTTLFTIAAVILLMAFTPLLSLIIRFVPHSMFDSLYQEIILAENTEILDNPLTFNKPLPILGTESGVCFSIKAGNMTIAQRKRAETGQHIANIIATGSLGQQYELRSTSLTRREKEKLTVICQKLGRTYSTTADQIIKITITPIKPFTPTRITWVTAIDVLDTRADYVP